MDEFQEKLLITLKKKTPPHLNTVDMLADILCIRREAAYRRLRGEIDFSIKEFVKLSQTLNILLPELMNGEESKKLIPGVIKVFDSKDKENVIDNYYTLMSGIVAMAKRVKEGENPTILNNASFFPHQYTFKYENFAKLRLYTLLYSQYEEFKRIKFSEFIIPDKITEVEQTYSREMDTINVVAIHMKDFFNNFFLNFKRLYQLRILSDKELEIQKNELLLFLRDLEIETANGMNEYGASFNIYISDIKFATNCIYVSSSNFESMMVQLFGNNLYVFNDESSIRDAKSWMESLMEASTLISLSGAKQRIEFFKNQREIIQSL